MKSSVEAVVRRLPAAPALEFMQTHVSTTNECRCLPNIQGRQRSHKGLELGTCIIVNRANPVAFTREGPIDYYFMFKRTSGVDMGEMNARLLGA
jgi:hypothetical protein